MSKVLPVLFLLLGLGLGFVVFRGAAGQADDVPEEPVRPQAPVGSAFTYQGRLDVDGAPAEGTYDFRFRLFDASTGGNQVGNTVTVGDVAVTGGFFTVQLDFGAAAFNGQARWLEVAVRAGSSDGAYNTLAGRQPLTAAPYAVHATQAGSVTWSGLTDVPAGFADGVDDVGLTAVTWADVQNRPEGLDDGDDDTTYAAGAGLALAGTTFSAEGNPYGNVLVVAKSGGDFNSVQAALDSVGDAGADNPYLVYVAPGVYTETVTLKSHVTLEGAGEGTTIIRALGGSQSPANGNGSATLVGADYATVRRLTVESQGAGQNNAVALYNDAASPALSDVTLTASDGSRNYGVYNSNSSSPTMTDVTATTSGGTYSFAIVNASSSPNMTNVIATASDGTYNRGVYNDSSVSLMMTKVAVSASGGSYNYGIYNYSSSATMTDVTATASGGTRSYAVYNTVSTYTMTNVTASASDGSENYGVYNYNSSAMITNAAASASGGTYNRGVYNHISSATIRHSVLEGTTASVSRSGTSGTVKVANSHLIGPVLGTGLTCFNNYDATLSAVICP